MALETRAGRQVSTYTPPPPAELPLSAEELLRQRGVDPDSLVPPPEPT